MADLVVVSPNGTVELTLVDHTSGDEITFELDSQRSRALGEKLFKAGCQAKPIQTS